MAISVIWMSNCKQFLCEMLLCLMYFTARKVYYILIFLLCVVHSEITFVHFPVALINISVYCV